MREEGWVSFENEDFMFKGFNKFDKVINFDKGIRVINIGMSINFGVKFMKGVIKMNDENFIKNFIK